MLNLRGKQHADHNGVIAERAITVIAFVALGGGGHPAAELVRMLLSTKLMRSQRKRALRPCGRQGKGCGQSYSQPSVGTRVTRTP